MKTHYIVRITVCCLLSVMMASCSEYRPTTSHFGHGNYRCYYHDVRTGQFFKGVADEEHEAVRFAKNACLQAPPKDLDHQYCQFAECLFK